MARSTAPGTTSDLFERARGYRSLYLMLVPGLLYYAVYRYAPMVGNLIAFKDYSIADGILRSPWAEPRLKHFVYLFSSPYFGQLMRNTLLISFYKLVWGMSVAVTFALMLNEVRGAKYKKAIQTITYLPHFLSWVIVYGIAFAMLGETSGVVNILLRELTGRTVPFLTSPLWFRSMLIASEVWKDTGWAAIIYLAAIAGIDPSLYEAAYIDGAGRFAAMWHITLSCIRTVIVLTLLLRLGRVMDAGFDQIYVMYNVHVLEVSDIIDTWVYRTGLEQLNFSIAAAAGLFKALIALALVATVNRIARSLGEAAW